jgi:cytochrome c oxidase subunit II
MTAYLQRRRLLVGAAAGVFGLLAAAMATPAQERVIQVRAKRFVFEPDRIELARGVPITFEFTSLDVPMGFNVPDFGVRSDIVPGIVTRLHLIPDTVGSFPFHCDIFCGSGHETMSGMLVVS